MLSLRETLITNVEEVLEVDIWRLETRGAKGWIGRPLATSSCTPSWLGLYLVGPNAGIW